MISRKCLVGSFTYSILNLNLMFDHLKFYFLLLLNNQTGNASPPFPLTDKVYRGYVLVCLYVCVCVFFLLNVWCLPWRHAE